MSFQALMLAAAIGSTVCAGLSAQLPPRDGGPAPASSRETQLQAQISASAADLGVYLEVAKLQEQRRAYQDAEATFLSARAAFASDGSLLHALAGFYNRRGRFDDAMHALEQAAALKPSDPAGYHLIGTYYQQKATKDPSLSPEQKLEYVRKGIEAEERALALDPDHLESLVYKNILLRMLANAEPDRGRQEALLSEADLLRNRALEIQKQRGGPLGSVAPGAPPPPPPPAAPSAAPQMIDGQMPIRIGGSVPPPTKIRDVRPVYPMDALNARVQGVVILEAIIDTAGLVRDARVLRSIPLLDQAALDAVQQWQFTPTIVDGIARPVIMTVTVNFTVQP